MGAGMGGVVHLRRLGSRRDPAYVDLNKKPAVWERFYNVDRPHGAHGGKKPSEALWKKLSE